jgi:hypothetical protein|tara:strand:+ start:256 stop:513 length:258 start_codon:yes stop_codon:yes gene_type:complete
MLLYLETDLDRAYKIDRRERSKNNKPWILREDFRLIYEELINLYIHQAINNMLKNNESKIYPAWVLDQVDQTLQNDISISLEDNV